MVTQNMLRTHEGKYVFSVEKMRCVTALDLIRLLLTCADIFELPSNISIRLETMVSIKEDISEHFVRVRTTGFRRRHKTSDFRYLRLLFMSNALK